MARDPLQGDRGGGVVSALRSGLFRAVGPSGPVTRSRSRSRQHEARPTAHGCWLAVAAAALALPLTGCMVDGLAARVAEGEPPSIPPPAADAVIEGEVATGLAGAVAELRSPPPASAALGAPRRVGPDGSFSFSLPGTESFTNLVVWLRRGQRVLLGLVPPVEKQRSVYEQGEVVDADELAGWTGKIDDLTTARLVLLAEVTAARGGFSATHPRLLQETLIRLGQAGEQRTPAVMAWEAEFSRLFLLADEEGDGPPLVEPSTLRLNGAFLDDRLERTVTEAKLAAAAAEVEIERCFSPTVLRVVFQVEMKDGMLDGACRSINRWKSAKDAPGKRMYFTGGVHVDYPGGGLDEQWAQELVAGLGSWQPNQVAMYDDGTHGDAAAGDAVWTLALDLPRLDPPLMIGYKYTWGLAGEGWTETQEFPGNSRLLRLVDVNGDGVISRYDRFCDEASNKDKANMNPAALGSLDWDEDIDGDDIPESEESPEDLDGDCVADGWFPLAVGPVQGDPDREGGCSR